MSYTYANPEWESSKQAATKSWSHPYQGDTVDHLYRYMMEHDPSTLYARLLPLVQSAGMGKSRLIDEFSKKYFVIPFNLREGNHGYPAPDTAVYNWLTLWKYNSRQNDDRFSAFLTALFEEVYKVIKDPKAGILERIQGCAELSDADKAAALRDYPDSLSGQFRLFMTVGQKFERQGPLRIKFYGSVLREADELYESVDLSEAHSPGKFKKRGPTTSEGVVELQTVIQRVWDIVGNSASSPSRIMVLAFDEAHTLFYNPDEAGQTPFTSLRRALRGMRQHPIWSVFLSTKVKSSPFVPPPYRHPSDCILKGLLLNVTPFTLLGFDQVAKKFQENMTLADVTSPSFRYSLGRPLWLTRYENGCSLVRHTMVDFATQKLLRGWQDCTIFGDTREFAIMSRRLALDFDTTLCNDLEKQETERYQMTQVERHMRVCLRVKEGLDSAVTVAASEPILSEAAAIVMRRLEFRSCRSLRNILRWPGMSKGDRGELVTCNISIDTLDSVMFENGQLTLSVEVTSYFRALFASDIYTKKIQSMLPSKLANEGRKRTFAATFSNSRIYVTHFIKVYDHNVLSVEFLAKCAARGVAIVCAGNQRAVDIVIPVVIDKDRPLTKGNLTALLLQSKNVVEYSTTVFPSLFHVMDPYTLGIFDKSTENPPPVIRMVYALASRKSGVCVVLPPQRKAVPKKKKYAYTSFDIWCGRASSSTFRAIRTHENGIYEELLELTRLPKMFQPLEEHLMTSAMSMYPCGTSSTGHWQSFCETSQEHPDEEMIVDEETDEE